ncbi:MAG: LacI family transcriptional regulator [Chlorobi bacterium]|nr:LacI family transcriptional regulator [Chlorobiota bacterium]
MKTISLLGLARQAGVSKTTVSLVLNGKAEKYNISRKTIEKVLALAREKNYRPNILARSFSMGKSMSIGFVTSYGRFYVSGKVISLLDKIFGEKGYRLVPVFTGKNRSAEVLTEELIERGVDAVCFFGYRSQESSDLLNQRGVPFVVLDVDECDENENCVMFDADQGVKKLIGFWYTHGKRTIGYIGLSNGNNMCRLSYAENYVERFSMKNNFMMLLKNGDDEKQIAQYLNELKVKGVNAIMFENPEIAYHSLKILKEPGMGFEDIALGSLGYHQAFDVAAKNIVYVDLSYEKMVKASAELMADILQEKTPGVKKLKIDTTLNQ